MPIISDMIREIREQKAEIKQLKEEIKKLKEKDIVFKCNYCNLDIVRNSKEHDAKCFCASCVSYDHSAWSRNGKKWYCQSCHDMKRHLNRGSSQDDDSDSSDSDSSDSDSRDHFRKLKPCYSDSDSDSD